MGIIWESMMNKLQLRLKQCYLTDKWLDITKQNIVYLKENVSAKHSIIKYNKNIYRGEHNG